MTTPIPQPKVVKMVSATSRLPHPNHDQPYRDQLRLYFLDLTSPLNNKLQKTIIGLQSGGSPNIMGTTPMRWQRRCR